jgi:hypothetical protein
MSRGKAFRIGDLNQKEVFEYFRKCGLTDVVDSSGSSLHLRLFNLVGGRFVKLKIAVTEIKAGVSFEGIFNFLFYSTSNHRRFKSVTFQRGVGPDSCVESPR